MGIILGKFSKKSDEEFRAKIIISQRNNTHFIENSLHNKTTNRNNSVSNFSASKSQNVTFKNLGEVLGSSINNSISTILMIGGFVVIFSVIISILNQTHALDFLSKFFNPILAFLGFDLNFAKPLLSGILELTNGVNLISGVHIKAISQNVILCAFLLGFGGFSVLLQVFSIVAKTDLSMKKYFIGKFMQGIFAAIYTFLALKFIPFINLDIIQTSSTTSNSLDTLTNATNALYSYFYDLGIFVIGVIIVFVILVLSKKI